MHTYPLRSSAWFREDSFIYSEKIHSPTSVGEWQQIYRQPTYRHLSPNVRKRRIVRAARTSGSRFPLPFQRQDASRFSRSGSCDLKDRFYGSNGPFVVASRFTG